MEPNKKTGSLRQQVLRLEALKWFGGVVAPIQRTNGKQLLAIARKVSVARCVLDAARRTLRRFGHFSQKSQQNGIPRKTVICHLMTFGPEVPDKSGGSVKRTHLTSGAHRWHLAFVAERPARFAIPYTSDLRRSQSNGTQQRTRTSRHAM
jgi:hypothetical protein